MRILFCYLLFYVPFFSTAQYLGTGAVTQGLATTTVSNIYSCPGGRIPAIGTIPATNNSMWTVPAEVNFTNTSFPFASDLYNPCTGVLFANDAAALAALNGSDIVIVDANGELITTFIFADNYFEMYVNGVAVGKDNVPYTQFNSNIVRFRVNRPFTISMLLVDWEEHLGLGSEVSNGFQYHDGDGGMVAVFKDSTNNIIATTGSDWKAQTFYTSPITDLACPTENGSQRLSNNCSTQDTNNRTGYYGLHWVRPSNWTDATYNDASWPAASTYNNATVGLNNKPAYTNFTNIFDAPTHDAQFIWSTNLILDNEVIVRHTVPSLTAMNENLSNELNFQVYPNPFSNHIQLKNTSGNETFEMTDAFGKIIFSGNKIEQHDFSDLPVGLYFLKVINQNNSFAFKLLKNK